MKLPAGPWEPSVERNWWAESRALVCSGWQQDHRDVWRIEE